MAHAMEKAAWDFGSGDIMGRRVCACGVDRRAVVVRFLGARDETMVGFRVKIDRGIIIVKRG
jgi:hypothetical protein